MINCIFIEDKNDSNIKKCSQCGRIVKTSRKAEEIKANCSTFRGNSTLVMPTIIGPGVDEEMEEYIKNQNSDKTDFEKPSTLQKIGNFLGALKDFVEDPSFVTKAQYEERLNICNKCPFRVSNTCGKCGCYLNVKAKGKAFHCPEKKWPGDK